MPSAHSISYLILAHEDPQQLRALLQRLSTESVRCYVHVDAKAELASFRRAATGIPHVRFCEPPIEVTWAGFSVVEATLRLIETALADHDKCARFVLLSGTDYPIASNGEIFSFFAKNPQRQFIRRFPILEADDVQRWKVRGRHFREWAPRYSWGRLPLFALERTLRVAPRPLPTEWPLMGGSQWWALTSDCARYCLEFARSHPDVLRFFRRVFAPDEIFFHTVVHQSPFALSADPVESFTNVVTKSGSLAHYANLHHLPGGVIASADDVRAALNAGPGKLFARKFSTRVSAFAIRLLDDTLERAEVRRIAAVGRRE